MTAFEVRRGNPTPEELAIAISVLRAAANAHDVVNTNTQTPRTWAAPQQQHRPAVHRFGPRQWILAQRIR